MNEWTGESPELSPEDQRLLDALVEVEFDVERLRLEPGARARLARLRQLMDLLEDYPVDDADPTLIDATLARIDRAEAERGERMLIDSGAASQGGRRIRLPDFVTVAAVLLIAASVGLPILSQVRQRSIDQRCEDNMRYLSQAFAYYANDNDNALPMAKAGVHEVWSRIASNVLNLQPLLEQGYCDHGHLDCPGHESGIGDSYAYQWQAADMPAKWRSGPGTVFLSDRNPTVDAARTGTVASPLSNSPNHSGRGQNALRTDGSTMWLRKPVVGRGDNIWLPEGFDELVDGIAPRVGGDVFLTQ